MIKLIYASGFLDDLSSIRLLIFHIECVGAVSSLMAN